MLLFVVESLTQVVKIVKDQISADTVETALSPKDLLTGKVGKEVHQYSLEKLNQFSSNHQLVTSIRMDGEKARRQEKAIDVFGLLSQGPHNSTGFFLNKFDSHKITIIFDNLKTNHNTRNK